MEQLAKTYKNFLNREDWDYIFDEYINKPRWSYGHYSNRTDPTVENPPAYWRMDLDGEEFFEDFFLSEIERASGMEFDLIRVYAGGNTFGTSGDIHTDGGDDNEYTFLYHASPDVWTAMWGGKTSFYGEHHNEYYEFTPNMGILFKSNILHVGEPTTKFFTTLRVCIAFKLSLKS